jgi:hypothetical protein
MNFSAGFTFSSFGKTWVGPGSVFFEKIKSKLKNIFQISDMVTHFCKSI